LHTFSLILRTWPPPEQMPIYYLPFASMYSFTVLVNHFLHLPVFSLWAFHYLSTLLSTLLLATLAWSLLITCPYHSSLLFAISKALYNSHGSDSPNSLLRCWSMHLPQYVPTLHIYLVVFSHCVGAEIALPFCFDDCQVYSMSFVSLTSAYSFGGHVTETSCP
jgi:hypothetical protein